MFSKWFAKGEARPAYPLATETDFALVWDEKHSLPIPDWPACEPLESQGDEEKNAHWSCAAASWLAKLTTAFEKPLELYESEDFFLLSALDLRESDVLLDYAQRALNAARYCGQRRFWQIRHHGLG
jgi:hypothetical protein